jgi:hypothetical protein
MYNEGTSALHIYFPGLSSSLERRKDRTYGAASLAAPIGSSLNLESEMGLFARTHEARPKTAMACLALTIVT